MVIKFLIMTFRILPNWITKIVTSVIGKRTKKLKPYETTWLTQTLLGNMANSTQRGRIQIWAATLADAVKFAGF